MPLITHTQVQLPFIYQSNGQISENSVYNKMIIRNFSFIVSCGWNTKLLELSFADMGEFSQEPHIARHIWAINVSCTSPNIQ